MPQSYALILPFQPTLHRVSFSNDTIQNAPKHYETHKTRGHGPMGWIGCVRCQVSCSDEHWQMHPKLWNAPKHEFRVQCGGSGAFIAKKFRCDFIAQTCPLIAPVQPILHRVSCSNETLPNAPNTMKCSKTWVVQWGRLGAFVAKNSDAFYGTNLCIDCTSSTRFAPSSV